MVRIYHWRYLLVMNDFCKLWLSRGSSRKLNGINGTDALEDDDMEHDTENFNDNILLGESWLRPVSVSQGCVVCACKVFLVQVLVQLLFTSPCPNKTLPLHSVTLQFARGSLQSWSQDTISRSFSKLDIFEMVQRARNVMVKNLRFNPD